MAVVEISKQNIVNTGLVATYTEANSNAADGFATDNSEGGSLFLHVKNSLGSAKDIVVQTPATIAGLAVADLSVAVANGAEKFIGPFKAGLFNQSDTDTGVTQGIRYKVVDTGGGWAGSWTSPTTGFLIAAVKLPAA